jgi:competence protein ComEC
LLFIWGFTLVTGATASVVRAAMMFSILLVGRAIYRNTNIWNIIAAAAVLQLFFNPYLLFDAGFQLSYSAVVGMVYFYPKFEAHLPKYKSWLKKFLVSNLLVGITAQLGTLPLSLFYFHQFPIYFWLSGLVVVLGGSLFLYACFVLGLFAVTIPILANILGVALSYFVWIMNKCIYVIQDFPFAMIEGIWVANWAVFLLYLCMCMITLAFTWKRPYYFLAGLGVFAFLMLSRMIHKINAIDNKKMVIYSLNKHSFIDFFDGTQVAMLSDSVSEKQVKFTAQSNRWASCANVTQSANLQTDTLLVADNVLWRPPFLQFFDKKMLLIDDAKWLNTKLPIELKSDTILLRQSPSLSLMECKEKFGSNFFIFDASNSIYKTTKWKKECEENHLSYYDIREEGALSIVINQ